MYVNRNSCWPGVVDSDQTCFRYVDKEVIGNEEYLFSNYYREQINQYGTRITYYVNNYNVLSADNFYGEDPTRKYAPGVSVIAMIELSENANTLTKFGFQADDELTLHIHISAFQDAFWDVGTQYITTTQDGVSSTPNEITTEYTDPADDPSLRTETPNTFETQYNQIQPKSGDVFALTEYGKGRPGDRGAKLFEVTEILDQDIAQYNQLGGHYTWIVKAKRFDYSFEPGLSAEPGSQQVYDSAYNGILSGGTQDPSVSKKYYEQDNENNKLLSINDISREQIFNMPRNDNTDVYGGY